MQTITTELIEKALALTGKTMDYVIEDEDAYWKKFSIQKFCYYLLSPEFIEKYKKINDKSKSDGMHESYYVRCFGNAIYEYQKGNSKSLIELLSKI